MQAGSRIDLLTTTLYWKAPGLGCWIVTWVGYAYNSPLSYVRCRSWGALLAAFRCPALRTTRRPEAFRG